MMTNIFFLLDMIMVFISCVFFPSSYKSGLILVVGLDEGDLKVLCKLRGHESEVHSIAWCPVSTDYIEFGMQIRL